jgi:hypothetical protein
MAPPVASGPLPYDRGMPITLLTLLALAGLLALVAMIPTRRLFIAGWSTGGLTVYFAIVWLLSVLVAWGPGRSRFVLPLLVVAYAAPFLPLRSALDRILGRQPKRPPPRNVTPPDAR